MKNLGQLLLVPIALLALSSPALAQASPPVLNGNYGSEGSGTVNGQPVTEISHWVFNQNKLVGFSQAINWGGKLTYAAQQYTGAANSDGESWGLCEMSLSGGPTTSQSSGWLSVSLVMSTGTFDCPFDNPHNGSGYKQPTDETYLIISENGGNEFSYTESGEEVGCGFQVPNCLGLPISIAGHGVKLVVSVNWWKSSWHQPSTSEQLTI
jgi:hypothetical protein